MADMQVGDLRPLHGAQRTRGFDDDVEIVDVNVAVAVGARHLVIDLGDHEAGLMGGGQGGIDADAEAAEAVGVGRRDLHERDIERHGAADEQFFDLAEIDGRVVGAAIVDGVAHIAADEHCIVAEMSRHLGSDVGRRSHGHHVDDFHVLHVTARAS